MQRGDFQKLSQSFEKLCMTFEGFGEMFRADFADTCIVKISAGVDGGLSGGSSLRRPKREDPHRRQRKFLKVVEED